MCLDLASVDRAHAVVEHVMGKRSGLVWAGDAQRPYSVSFLILVCLFITGAASQQLCLLGFSNSFHRLPQSVRLRGFTSTDSNFSAPFGVGCSYNEVAATSTATCESSCVASATCQGFEYVAVARECKLCFFLDAVCCVHGSLRSRR